jgi:uncharacterized membrane protein YjgN (DUF898 family)
MNDAVSALTTITPVAGAVAAALAAMPAPMGVANGAAPAPSIARDPPIASGDASGTGQQLRFHWVGSPWSLVGPCLFNALMTLATVGIYSFWGRTEIRKRVWGSVRLDGEPLVYHGTGMELFKGFMGVLLIVLLPIFLLSTTLVIVYGQASSGWVLYQVALFVVVYPVLKALATYRARRYRLARTSWRGVRGSMSGASGEFAFLSWATSLLYPLTLGWIAPWRALYIQRFLAGDTMLGDRRLDMKGSTPSLYLRFGLLWIATLVIGFVALSALVTIVAPIVDLKSQIDWERMGPTIAFRVLAVVLVALFVWSPISAFYRSSLYNMSVSATSLMPPGSGSSAPAATPRFQLTTTGRSLLWLFVTNQFITYGSLFILRPVATARSMRYFASNLSIVGAFDPASIRQNPNAARAEGEGLAQAFDFDAF